MDRLSSGTSLDRQAGAANESRAWGPLAQARAGMVLLNESWQITEISAEALRLLHCGLPFLSGADFWDSVPQDIAEQYQSATEKALAAGAQHAFVAHHEFEASWLEYTFRRCPAGYSVSLRDVASTQTLQQLLDDSERYHHMIFEANPNAMWIFDVASRVILAANRAAVDFYGISRKRFLGLSLGSLFPDGDGRALLSSLATGQTPGDVAFKPQLCKQQKMDGQQVLVELACSRISWNDQQAVLVSLADVSDRHLADRALRRENAGLELENARLQGELKNTRRDLAAFTYALSNDLQDPLHSANGFAAMLAEKYFAVLDEPGRHYVKRIQASTRQLAKLVDDLRTLVQLPALSGTLESVDVVRVCRVLINEYRKRDPSRVVTVEMDGTLELMADKPLLITALACLLENAWKFTSKKPEAWIKVALLPGKSAGERVLAVSDNGTGFDAAYADKLFKVFQRLHSSADFPGSGLGLAIVQRVAERHGGRAWGETEPHGASFFIAFPQAQPGLP